MAKHYQNYSGGNSSELSSTMWGLGSLFLMITVGGLLAWLSLTFFRVDVPTAHMAILIKKTGIDLTNDQEIAPTKAHKGVQTEFLLEGKHWLNPYDWDWKVIPQTEIPAGKMGVLISLSGDDLGYGEFLAKVDPAHDVLSGGVLSKGIVPEVLREARYSINPYLFDVEIHDPVIIPAGFYGVVTNLAGPIPKDPNVLLVESGYRGVQKEVLESGTNYWNPYQYRIDLIDCRSQRFNLSENKDMGFPTKDGFWVSLDGIIEFHVNPERAAEVYVTFNDSANGVRIDEEIIDKVIMPIARSYCRVEGSKNSGREFITGNTRAAFEENFEKVLRRECEPLGVEILQALITNIRPPQQIAEPVRERELAKQDQTKFTQQILQQQSEQEYATEKEMVNRKKALVNAEQEVVTVITEAKRQQEVAIIEANEKLAVAKTRLKAAADEAEAIRYRGKAQADIVTFNNKAEAAGWARSVEAFNGNGSEFARYILHQKLAPAYRNIMANTDTSPIMKIFEEFAKPTATNPPAAVPQLQQVNSRDNSNAESNTESDTKVAAP